MSSVRPLAAVSVLVALLLGAGCSEKPQGAALVPDAAVVATPIEAGPVDITQCTGCQLLGQAAWAFQGIYADATCTDPLAQLVASACAVVPALGATAVTYVDEVGGRKAGESANVTLTAQVAPETARYRKAGKDCVRANEAAVDVTPLNCEASRVCRDANGALACTGCRTFANGCPDLEETRMYATINDPVARGAKPAGGGGGNIGRLGQCCTALAAEAKRLGSSPEAGMLTSAAAQCTALVKAAGPTGTAPELGAIRTMLAGRNVPAICAGF